MKKRIAILGGGPSGMFMFKRLISRKNRDIEIDIFERKKQLGVGMPYSTDGASDEHITNVSANEIPQIVTSMQEWIQTVPKSTLKRFCIDADRFNEYKVLPRLLFGQYLSDQFDLLLQLAKQVGILARIHFETAVTDIIDHPELEEVWLELNTSRIKKFDCVVVSTGHNWPLKEEGLVPGYFGSPYPPAKLAIPLNHPVALRGSSLTAIDAIRTLARHNGHFEKDAQGKLAFTTADKHPDFRIMLHSTSGLLPAVRFHLEDSHLSSEDLLSQEEIDAHIASNNGFLSLDFIFEKNFKEIFRERDAAFYDHIRNLSLEQFVHSMMELRERLDPFLLLKAEYAEAEKSIKRKESVYWKEMLAILSFAMNYPAKYLSAEDMLRLQLVLMPLISIVIAFVPQGSCQELLALHEAGVLGITAVGKDSRVETEKTGGITYHFMDEANNVQAVFYQTYVDCVGQPHLSYEEVPFKTLLTQQTISPARVKFRSAEAARLACEAGNTNIEADEGGDYYLRVPGISINDKFQVIDPYGAYNDRIYIMAVPYIGGFNPDYSGLDFCEEASGHIVNGIFAEV